MSIDTSLPTRHSRGRPGPVGLIAHLTAHGLISFLRSPVAAFFTVGLPVLFLVIIGGLFGNEVVEPRGGIRIAQFFTPALAVFGAAQAAFCVLATDTARLREEGVFKRLQGTPASWSMVLWARICSAVIVAVLTAGLVLAVGIEFYQVQIIWRTMPAAAVTLILGVAAFAALGLTIVALLRSAAAVQTLTNGLLISLAFISDVFAVSTGMPRWLDVLGWLFPLKHFANALGDAFNPFLGGSGFAIDHLAVLAAWGLAGALIAAWAFGRERRAGGRGAAVTATTAGRTRPALAYSTPGRPSAWRSLRTQIGYASLGLSRDAASVFFALVFPVLLLALFPVLSAGAGGDRTEMAGRLMPAMMTYGLAITGYAVLPEPVARARERRVLARLAGTPMPRWSYLTGRITAALAATTASALVLIAVAAIGYRVPLDGARLPAAAVAFVLGFICFAALGFALLAVVRNAQTFVAVTLGTLLSLSFISEVFVIGAQMPRPLALIADVLPLKHTVHALNAALQPGVVGSGFAWADLAVVLAWTAGGLLVALRISWTDR